MKSGGAGFEPAASLAVFLASDDSDGLTGRLISAIWDDWRSLDKDGIRVIMEKGYYTLRRIGWTVLRSEKWRYTEEISVMKSVIASSIKNVRLRDFGKSGA